MAIVPESHQRESTKASRFCLGRDIKGRGEANYWKVHLEFKPKKAKGFKRSKSKEAIFIGQEKKL